MSQRQLKARRRRHRKPRLVFSGVSAVFAAAIAAGYLYAGGLDGASATPLSEAPAQAQRFGGNESLNWSIPGGAASGVNELTFPITVNRGTAHRSGAYFAMQYGFMNQNDGGYTGLQPYPDADGHHRLRGVFSSFIQGSVSTDPNCSNGADGGAGVSCGVEFNTTYGHSYDVTVKRIGENSWKGDILDTSDGTVIHIGTYTLPGGSGQLRTSHAGFVEYYNVPSCSEQPRYDVTFGNPRSGGVQGTSTWVKEYGDCPGAGNLWVGPSRDGVRIARGSIG